MRFIIVLSDTLLVLWELIVSKYVGTYVLLYDNKDCIIRENWERDINVYSFAE